MEQHAKMYPRRNAFTRKSNKKGNQFIKLAKYFFTDVPPHTQRAVAMSHSKSVKLNMSKSAQVSQRKSAKQLTCRFCKKGFF